MSADVPMNDDQDNISSRELGPGDSEANDTRMRSSTPELVHEEDREDVLRIATEISGRRAQGKQVEDALYAQLVHKAIQLSSSAIPSQTQLVAQAEAISNLSQQRQFLLERSMEEKQRWQRDREGWSRNAEILIGLGQKNGPTIYKEQEARHNAALEQQNALLRQRLADTQSRLLTIETELARMKPLLLMQPYALMHSHHSLELVKPPRRRNADTSAQDETSGNPSATEPTTPKPNPNVSYYRRHDQQLLGTGKRNSSVQPLTPIKPKPRIPSQASFADARSEHMLLAAKKIGRERATILSAAQYHYPPQHHVADPAGGGQSSHSIQPSSSSSAPGPSTPRTPLKPAIRPRTPGVAHGPPASYYRPPQPYAFVPGPGYPFYGAGAVPFTPQSAPSAVPGSSSPTRQPPKTPAATTAPATKSTVETNPINPKHNNNFFAWKTTLTPPTYTAHNQPEPEKDATKSPAKAKPGNLTALDSLYTVARSVLTPASNRGGATPNKGSLRFRMQESADDSESLPDFHPESPTPKRRRLVAPNLAASTSKSSTSTAAGEDQSKAMSALDVLANQAASHAGSSPAPARSSTPALSNHDRNAEVEVEGLAMLTPGRARRSTTKSPQKASAGRKAKAKEAPSKRKGKGKEVESVPLAPTTPLRTIIEEEDDDPDGEHSSVTEDSVSSRVPAKRKRGPIHKPPDISEAATINGDDIVSGHIGASEGEQMQVDEQAAHA